MPPYRYGHSHRTRLGAYKGPFGQARHLLHHLHLLHQQHHLRHPRLRYRRRRHRPFGQDARGQWITGKYVPKLVAGWPAPVKDAAEVPDALTVRQLVSDAVRPGRLRTAPRRPS